MVIQKLCRSFSQHNHVAGNYNRGRSLFSNVGNVQPSNITGIKNSETMIHSQTEITDQWEIDVYSRPVVQKDGKKLWELLICDSSGNFKHRESIQSNMVNSREVRKAVEAVIENVQNTDLFNYSNDFTNSDREKNVYPFMEGYSPSMKNPSFFDIRTPSKLPDVLRGEKYAFVALPVTELRQGGSINEENIGYGRLCPVDVDIPDDEMIQGIAVFTKRAAALAMWLSGIELAFLKADLKRREIVMECGINTQYLVARVMDEQRDESQNFEVGKKRNSGLHFFSVQSEPDADKVEGFWLLKEIVT